MDKTIYPRISLITPSFNQAEYIVQTIDSVLGQDYPNLEYMVIDGGSTDGTVEILRNYDGKFFWISEPDQGQSDALNKGFRKANGEIVGFINSDDYLEPGTLRRVGLYFANHPETYWLSGRCRTVDDQGEEIRKGITAYKNFWLGLKSYSVLLVLNYISQPATFWCREVMDKVGYFDESLQFAMEYDYWLRVGKHYKLHVINDYLANFRVHSSSKAGSSARNQFDSGFAIAQKYIQNPIFGYLHRFHNSITVFAYRHLLARNSGLYSS